MTHHHHHPHPPSRLSRLPPFISHFLGYRTHPLPARPPHIIYLWSFIGSFVGLAVIQAVFGQANYFMERGVPGVVASYGATAVLIYGAIEAPLAQPLPTFGGHLLGALVGVCITKLFGLIRDQAKFESLLWLSGSLACSTTIVLMQMTGTTHPPAGATALLASTNTEIRLLGWYYLPVVMLTSVLVLVIAMVNNNIQRRYPVFWFTPGSAPAFKFRFRPVAVPELKAGMPTGVEKAGLGEEVREVRSHHGHAHEHALHGVKNHGGDAGERGIDEEKGIDLKMMREDTTSVKSKGGVTEVKESEVDEDPETQTEMTETERSVSRSGAGSSRRDEVV